MCVCETDRERERERERESVCVCVCERESESVCERERECVCVRERGGGGEWREGEAGGLSTSLASNGCFDFSPCQRKTSLPSSGEYLEKPLYNHTAFGRHVTRPTD